MWLQVRINFLTFQWTCIEPFSHSIAWRFLLFFKPFGNEIAFSTVASDLISLNKFLPTFVEFNAFVHLDCSSSISCLLCYHIVLLRTHWGQCCQLVMHVTAAALVSLPLLQKCISSGLHMPRPPSLTERRGERWLEASSLIAQKWFSATCGNRPRLYNLLPFLQIPPMKGRGGGMYPNDPNAFAAILPLVQYS